MQTADPVLAEFRHELSVLYGDCLDRVVLFGSRARGDARADSDYDIAVFLKNIQSFAVEGQKIAALETEILYARGAVINALPFLAESYRAETGFMQEVRRDGRDL